VTKPEPKYPKLPIMSARQQRGIVDECFFERRHFLRQLFQSLPNVLLVFGSATRDAFIRAMQAHFVEGDPQVGEDPQRLLARTITLRYGKAPDGSELRSRILFVPHASGNPSAFAAVRKKVIAVLAFEARAGRLQLEPDGHLRRPLGDCTFCDNALYRIGDCNYREQLVPLSRSAKAAGAVHAADSDNMSERVVQEELLDRLLSQSERG
jgi:hypothetical protein